MHHSQEGVATYRSRLTSSALGATVSAPGPPKPSSSLSRASASSSNFWYRSRHWVAVRPTMGAMVRHWVGINLARCSSFSSSSRDHSTLRIPGSSHSTQRALHCFGVFLARSEDTRAHWFRPYFETYNTISTGPVGCSCCSISLTAARSTSSSMFVLKEVSKGQRGRTNQRSYQTPPLTTGMARRNQGSPDVTVDKLTKIHINRNVLVDQKLTGE